MTTAVSVVLAIAVYLGGVVVASGVLYRWSRGPHDRNGSLGIALFGLAWPVIVALIVPALLGVALFGGREEK